MNPETEEKIYFYTEDLQVGYGGKQILNPVRIGIKKGEILTLVGPNGAGKSTILKSVAAQLPPLGGAVYLDGADLLGMKGTERARRMAVMFTEKVHAEWMTCRDVVAAGRYPYNGSGLTNQKEWHKEVNYSAKAQFLFTKGLNLTLSIQSIQPEEIRVQSYDIGAYYESDRFHIEAEYLYKQYSDNAFKDVQAVNTFINYDLPLRKIFNKMSFLLRYDMMTDQSDAKTTDEETGALVTTDYKRQRLTGGITFSLSKAFRTDLRLNYEKYFYANSSIAKESEQDKIVLELMVRF